MTSETPTVVPCPNQSPAVIPASPLTQAQLDSTTILYTLLPVPSTSGEPMVVELLISTTVVVPASPGLLMATNPSVEHPALSINQASILPTVAIPTNT